MVLSHKIIRLQMVKTAVQVDHGLAVYDKSSTPVLHDLIRNKIYPLKESSHEELTTKAGLSPHVRFGFMSLEYHVDNIFTQIQSI